MKVNERQLEELFEPKLHDLYEGPHNVRSNDILLGYIAAILFEYRHGRETKQIFRKLLLLKEDGYIDFSPSLRQTISIYLSHGARPWAEFLTQGHLDGQVRPGRPPGIFRMTDRARAHILQWKDQSDDRFETFLSAHAQVRKEVV